MNPHQLNELSRRDFLARTARACFGLSIAGSAAQLFSPQALAADPAILQAGGGKAKHVIYLYMSGGMTHIDTFDPKPDAPAEYRGPTKAIGTNVDGIQLGHCLPMLAKHMDKVALIRSLSTTQGAHEQGKYLMHTSYTPRGTIVHPSSGAWAARLAGEQNGSIPSFVLIGGGNQHPGGGFFEPQYSPLPIGDPQKGLRNVRQRADTNDASFQRQLDLRVQLDHDFDTRFHKGQRSVRAYNEVYDSAVKMMHSKDLEAFDLSKEPADSRAAYGTERFGQGVLLARRLVERGVRFVEVEYGGFDWHSDNFELMEEKIPVLDQALSTLISDLQARGLLDSTLIVVATEFGRTPKIVENNMGRNHFPKAFSCLMAGGGIKGGQAYGKTDETASNVIEGKVGASDFNASIAFALGIPFDLPLMSPSKRPFRMGGIDGKPIGALFG
ncbi:DUF1501 domain-containing protein [Luteolibacter sp. SL250]|uniref:DUF1501 domain-containing protein n=1 Tax=Luteolibacter sp. SL250 TaxID=2995170 RepID=UPI002270D430|nr:DUF1501 domain-containing protein [Luteolibacter sp. SL250]WAC18907.1 DUF1501 domain-containing protein [Luteolibacter sp. SL250]